MDDECKTTELQLMDEDAGLGPGPGLKKVSSSLLEWQDKNIFLLPAKLAGRLDKLP